MGIANACHNLGIVVQEQGDLVRARELYETCLEAIRRALGDRTGEGATFNGLGIVARLQDDRAQSRTYHEASLAIKRTGGDRGGMATSLSNLGNVAVDEGDYAHAATLFEEALGLYGDRCLIVEGLPIRWTISPAWRGYAGTRSRRGSLPRRR